MYAHIAVTHNENYSKENQQINSNQNTGCYPLILMYGRLCLYLKYGNMKVNLSAYVSAYTIYM